MKYVGFVVLLSYIVFLASCGGYYLIYIEPNCAISSAWKIDWEGSLNEVQTLIALVAVSFLVVGTVVCES